MKLFDTDKPFYKGNLHTHTTRSDGWKSPEETLDIYAAHGYDFIALTDHWHISEGGRYGDMLLLPGVEYDFNFPTQVLHLVALYPDAACAAGIERGMSHEEVIRRVNGQGGLVIAAHPAWSLNTPQFLAGLDGVELTEVYNSMSDEPINTARGNSAQVLDVTAANGKLFRWVASDDTHFHQGEACRAFIRLQAEELTVDGVLNGLRAGKFYASQGPEFLSVEVTGDEMIVHTSPVSLCSFCSNLCWVAGRCHKGEGMTEIVHKIQPGEHFLRCEIVDAQGNRAWTSPIAIG